MLIGAQTPLEGDLSLVVDLYPKDRRRRDIDAPLKALLDLLTHANVWHDDSQVKQLIVTMHAPDGGRCVVRISPTNGS